MAAAVFMAVSKVAVSERFAAEVPAVVFVM
jgi:hypothetical protein